MFVHTSLWVLCVISLVKGSGWAPGRKSNSFLILAAALCLVWKGTEIVAFSGAAEHLHLEEASRGQDGLTRSKEPATGTVKLKGKLEEQQRLPAQTLWPRVDLVLALLCNLLPPALLSAGRAAVFQGRMGELH